MRRWRSDDCIATFPMKCFLADCDVWPEMHKCHAIPREEIALSFLKLPVRAGSNVSGMVPESLIYRKFCSPAKLSCTLASAEPIARLVEPAWARGESALRLERFLRRQAFPVCAFCSLGCRLTLGNDFLTATQSAKSALRQEVVKNG